MHNQLVQNTDKNIQQFHINDMIDVIKSTAQTYLMLMPLGAIIQDVYKSSYYRYVQIRNAVHDTSCKQYNLTHGTKGYDFAWEVIGGYLSNVSLLSNRAAWICLFYQITTDTIDQ